MNKELLQIIKETALENLDHQIKVQLTYQPVELIYQDIDVLFIDSILAAYKDYPEYVMVERYLLKISESDGDKESFFERQQHLIQKQLPANILSELTDVVIAFKVRKQTEQSILSYFQRYESFEDLVLKVDVSPRFTLQRQTVNNRSPTHYIRNATLSQRAKSVDLNTKQEYRQSMKLCGQRFFADINQYASNEQRVLLNVSKSKNKLIGEDSQSDEEDQVVHRAQYKSSMEVRESYLRYIYRDDADSIIRRNQYHSLTPLMKQVIQRPLLNSMPAESLNPVPRRLQLLNLKKKRNNIIQLNNDKKKAKYMINSYNPF